MQVLAPFAIGGAVFLAHLVAVGWLPPASFAANLVQTFPAAVIFMPAERLPSACRSSSM